MFLDPQSAPGPVTGIGLTDAGGKGPGVASASIGNGVGSATGTGRGTASGSGTEKGELCEARRPLNDDTCGCV